MPSTDSIVRSDPFLAGAASLPRLQCVEKDRLAREIYGRDEGDRCPGFSP